MAVASQHTGRQVGRLLSAVTLLLLVTHSAASAAADGATKSAMDYLLHCEGCHKADGSGQPGIVPAFKGSVARFLSTSDGRAYLARVPGTANSLLGDRERAEVLNWIVATFDPANIPATFVPYTQAELAKYRFDPLSAPRIERARILTAIRNGAGNELTGEAPRQHAKTDANRSDSASPASAFVAAPPQFGLCAACHSTSTDGASAMGPNLRGVVGRPAGTLPGFAYSRALRNSGIVWSPQELDGFLTNSSSKVPGSLMAFSGLPSAADRAVIIDYLSSLE